MEPQVLWWDSDQLCWFPTLPPAYPPLSCADGDVADVGTVALDYLPLVTGHFLEVAVTVTKQQKGLGIHAAGPFCFEGLAGSCGKHDCACSFSILWFSLLCNKTILIVIS